MSGVDYNPKHMIPKDETLDRWQAQTATAAALLSRDHRTWQSDDGMVWALLHTMAESRELLGVFYDYGVSPDYEPKHMVAS